MKRCAIWTAHYLQFDEIRGFIGKKEKRVTVDDNPHYGNVWTFCAVDAETKISPCLSRRQSQFRYREYLCKGHCRRLKNRVQISTDALRAYVDAIEKAFGADVDYGQIVKTYESVPIKEQFQGQTVWEGIVEVFHLRGHPKTDRVYAWAHETDNPEKPKKHITVLHLHPVTSPQAAVRAAIVQEFRNLEPAE